MAKKKGGKKQPRASEPKPASSPKVEAERAPAKAPDALPAEKAKSEAPPAKKSEPPAEKAKSEAPPAKKSEPPAEKAKSEAPPTKKSEPPAEKTKSGAPPAKKSEPPQAREEEDDDAEDEDDADEAPVAAKAPVSAKAPVTLASVKGPHAPRPQPWVRPFLVAHEKWTWFEQRLLVTVLLALVASMVAWVSLKGMALPIESESNAGTVFRALFGAAVLGGLSRPLTKKLAWDETRRAVVTIAAIVIGVVLARSWRATGVEWSGHMLNWLQEGSSLTMFGGLRGVSTRLTILLALVGASLAAATGKHINIDIALRFITERLRVPVFVLATSATSVFCVAAAWGFFDYTSIESFGAQRDWPRQQKIDHVSHHVSQNFFVWRKQVGLDLSAAPHVLGGGKWDDPGRMNGRQWNAFVESSGYRAHFTKEQVDGMLAPPEGLEESRIAMVIVPDSSPRGLLVHVMNLMFPIGLLLLAMRFVLRMILVLGGAQTTEPEPEFAIEEDDEAAEGEVAK